MLAGIFLLNLRSIYPRTLRTVSDVLKAIKENEMSSVSD